MKLLTALLAAILYIYSIAPAWARTCDDLADKTERFGCQNFWEISSSKFVGTLRRVENTCRFLKTASRYSDAIKFKQTQGWFGTDCTGTGCDNNLNVRSKIWGRSSAYQLTSPDYKYFSGIKLADQYYIGLWMNRYDVWDFKYNYKSKGTPLNATMTSYLQYGSVSVCRVRYKGTLKGNGR